jgi:AraC-like DNA-binding protein/quercetin dioxygenase-like cupin family protein
MKERSTAGLAKSGNSKVCRGNEALPGNTDTPAEAGKLEAVTKVDLEGPAFAFSLSEDLKKVDSGWHRHNKHQLLFSAKGSLHLEVEHSHWLLPPHRAAWISAGVSHRIWTVATAALRTIYLPIDMVAFPVANGCQVFSVNGLCREMILHAMRWTHMGNPEESIRKSYFETFAKLIPEWAALPLPFVLPSGETPELRKAMAYTLSHLENVDVERVSRAAGVSARTLARRFADETHMTWQQWTYTAQMLAAMELLSAKGARVTEVGLQVGFGSASAFTNSFAKFTGENPTRFRNRATRCYQENTKPEKS